MPEKNGSRWGEIRSNVDLVMLLVTAALFIFGVMAIYSAGGHKELTMSSYALRQMLWGGISAVVYAIILKIGYRNILAAAAPLFGAAIVLFVLLLIVGHTSKGAQSWFNLGFMRLQPSEIGKVIFAVALAELSVKVPPVDLRGISIFLGVSGIFILLIMLQPDLGSAMVYSVMLFAVFIAAGAPVKFLTGIVLFFFSMLPIAWMVLKPYQKMRLMIFIDPTLDPQGAGYNVIQSRIAVGSGGFFGKGFMHGTQGQLHFLPEPHTDFIFSVFSEEFGFIGCVAVLILFTVLLWRMLSTALYTKDYRAKIMTAGITAWIWFQMTESVGMSMGLMPVTGLPLPLFSYGGSSLMAVAMGLALVQSVAVMSKEDRF